MVTSSLKGNITIYTTVLKVSFWLILSSKIFLAYLNGVVIIVHGSFAVQENWHKPGGKFFEALEKKISLFQEKNLVSFCWSGIPTDSELKLSAQMLTKLIESYPSTENFILIGHSHGGNIINLCSQIISKQNAEQISQILKSGKTNIFKKIIFLDKVFLLATPIMDKYLPALDSILEIYNCFMEHDPIQTLFGIAGQNIPISFSQQVKNIRFILKRTTNLLPHTQIHNEVIAEVIPQLPQITSGHSTATYLTIEISENQVLLFNPDSTTIDNFSSTQHSMDHTYTSKATVTCN